MIKNNSNSTVAVKTLKRIERKAKWQLNTKTAAQGIVLQEQFLFISFFFLTRVLCIGHCVSNCMASSGHHSFLVSFSQTCSLVDS